MRSSHIGPGNINGGSNRIFLGQLDCILPGQSLNFTLRIILGVKADPALGPAVGKVDDGAFEGHEGCECLYFFDVDVWGVPGSSFGGQFVDLMLAAVCWNAFDGSII